MASTTAMFTGLSGLSSNARRLEVIGNNISNVNTVAYKSNRVLFAPTFNRNLGLGTSPSDASGGTNPSQVGLGVTLAGTQRNFNSGSVSTTGIDTDLAIEGEGFFIVNRTGQQFYTRVGSFQPNANNDLVTISGEKLQGYGVDSQFNIVRGRLTDVNIPIGTLTLAQATRNVTLSGNLNAGGVVGTQGSVLSFDQLLTGGVAATATTLLTALDSSGLNVGDEIRITGATRGDKDIAEASLTVSAAMNVNGFMSFLQDALGIVPNGGFTGVEPTGPQPGSVTLTGGVITVTGNIGTFNDIDLEATNIRVFDSAGTPEGNPFAVTKSQQANGESIRTTFVAFDSLGTALDVDLTMSLAFTDNGGTYWRTFLHSASDTDMATHLETGSRAGAFTAAAALLQFDSFGALVSDPSLTVEVDRLDTGAVDPLNFALTFSTPGDRVTAFSNASGTSALAAVSQDGSPLGVLTSFAVGADGVINGGFSNGLTRTIGQIALAGFTNQAGLIDEGNGLFSTGPNSGEPLITTPLDFGTGRIVGGALELSNVDLSQEFINMILTSTGYSAASRVITTADQLIQQLLILGR